MLGRHRIHFVKGCLPRCPAAPLCGARIAPAMPEWVQRHNHAPASVESRPNSRTLQLRRTSPLHPPIATANCDATTAAGEPQPLPATRKPIATDSRQTSHPFRCSLQTRIPENARPLTQYNNSRTHAHMFLVFVPGHGRAEIPPTGNARWHCNGTTKAQRALCTASKRGWGHLAYCGIPPPRLLGACCAKCNGRNGSAICLRVEGARQDAPMPHNAAKSIHWRNLPTIHSLCGRFW